MNQDYKTDNPFEKGPERIGFEKWQDKIDIMSDQQKSIRHLEKLKMDMESLSGDLNNLDSQIENIVNQASEETIKESERLINNEELNYKQQLIEQSISNPSYYDLRKKANYFEELTENKEYNNQEFDRADRSQVESIVELFKKRQEIIYEMSIKEKNILDEEERQNKINQIPDNQKSFDSDDNKTNQAIESYNEKFKEVGGDKRQELLTPNKDLEDAVVIDGYLEQRKMNSVSNNSDEILDKVRDDDIADFYGVDKGDLAAINLEKNSSNELENIEKSFQENYSLLDKYNILKDKYSIEYNPNVTDLDELNNKKSDIINQIAQEFQDKKISKDDFVKLTSSAEEFYNKLIENAGSDELDDAEIAELNKDVVAESDDIDDLDSQAGEILGFDLDPKEISTLSAKEIEEKLKQRDK